MSTDRADRLRRPLAIVQARLGSTRLPGKVLRPILGTPMLLHIVARLWHVHGLADVVVATSDLPTDEPIRRLCFEHGIACFAGSETDVLDRFYQAACRFDGDPVLRITADCPCIDPGLIGQLLQLFASGDDDHVGIAAGAGASKFEGGRFPSGVDTECMRFAALERAWREATARSDREHVTPYLWRVPGRFRLGVLKADRDWSEYRLSVDNEADLKLVTAIYEALYHPDRPFSFSQVMTYLTEHPELMQLNRQFLGKEGYSNVWNPPSE